MRYVLLRKFCAESGYTDRAVYRKMQEGHWIEGREYRRAPDGKILIDVEGVEKWVEGQRGGSNSARTV